MESDKAIACLILCLFMYSETYDQDFISPLPDYVEEPRPTEKLSFLESFEFRKTRNNEAYAYAFLDL